METCKRWTWCLAAALALTMGAGARATTPDAAQIARAGNSHGATACSACHGADGGGQAATGFPRLAHLDAAYLLKQLDDFASGARGSAVMKPIAQALGEPGRKAMAAYYAALPLPASARSTAGTSRDDALGRRLALRGRWDQELPACVQCHGPHGVGVGANFPPLAGQSAKYLADQLRAWKDGTRKNDPLALMQHVSAKLSDKDIQAVAAWFAAQPASVHGETP